MFCGSEPALEDATPFETSHFQPLFVIFRDHEIMRPQIIPQSGQMKSKRFLRREKGCLTGISWHFTV